MGGGGGALTSGGGSRGASFGGLGMRAISLLVQGARYHSLACASQSLCGDTEHPRSSNCK